MKRLAGAILIALAGAAAAEEESGALPDLMGLEPREVQALLGPVSLKRWEGAAQMMQFSNGECVLDVYFYEEAPNEAFRATFLAARAASGAALDPPLCLGALLEKAAGE